MTDFDRELISTVAHDLKTPISAVKGFLDLIQNAGPLNDAQRKFLNRALGSLDKMEHLVTNLLDMTRLQGELQLKSEPVDLRRLIKEAVDTIQGVALARGIVVQVEAAPGMGMVVGDVRLLSQVVNNLLSNAVKYNRDKGTVWVSLHEQPGLVRVDVRDSGIGIPLEDQPHVFKRFYRSTNASTRKIEGSGLGLAITKTIVQRHGGRIWLQSEMGVGTTFSFMLPRPQSRQEAAQWAGEETDGVDDRLQDSSEIVEVDSREDK